MFFYFYMLGTFLLKNILSVVRSNEKYLLAFHTNKQILYEHIQENSGFKRCRRL